LIAKARPARRAGCSAQSVLPLGYYEVLSKDDNFEIPLPEKSFALTLKEKLMNIQYNNAEDPFNWRFKVCD